MIKHLNFDLRSLPPAVAQFIFVRLKSMLRCLFALLLLFDISTAHAEEDEIVSSHKGFKIVQRRVDEGGAIIGGGVKQIIQFLKGPSRIVTLEYGISWP